MANGGRDGAAGAEGRDLRPPADVVRELVRKYEAGEIDKKQLADLGFTPEDLQAFAEKLSLKKRTRRVQDDEPLEPFDWGKDPNDLKGAERGDGSKVKPDATPEEREKLESLRKAIEQLHSDVSPEYREILEEYYRALSGH